MNTDAIIRNIRKTVLIVDDEIVNREILGYFIAEQYDVIYASNGQDALDRLRTHKGVISLILLDINMPVMNGIEMLRILMADETLSRIPVIVLTSEREKEIEALKAGAIDFITKPYDSRDIILQRIERVIDFVEDRNIIADVEHDSLTNLYTRNFFFEYGQTLMQTDPEQIWDMIAVDIDRFRLVNEVYGKPAGDEILCAVADGLRDVGKEHFGIACRVEADKYFLMIHHTDRIREITAHVEDRVARFPFNLTLRFGVYSGATDMDRIVWYSDAAVSACKAIRGKISGNVLFYDEKLHERELLNQRLLNDLHTALEQKQFIVYYQPKYDVSGDRASLKSAEALVRWCHSELGFVNPGVFVPLLEDNGLIHLVDEFVWREAAEHIKQWEDRYGIALPVSVNISRFDIFDEQLPEKLEKIIRETGIHEKDLILEITESAYFEDTDYMHRVIQQLRGMGFHIEMDDFGSGYSSLNCLCSMPVDSMKIDMQFVNNLEKTPKGYELLQLVVQIGHCMSLPIVVEGVETDRQYYLVRKAGCDMVQGYFFSPPVEAKKFEELIRREAEEAGI